VPASAWRAAARKHRDFPLLNTPHAFAGALQDTLAVVLIAAWAGDASAGFWGLALRYLKAPASLVGGAVSQALYPQLAQQQDLALAKRSVLQVMRTLALIAAPLMILLLIGGPALFALVFGESWREAGELARALSPYIAVHFVAAPLAVVTLAWRAQGWALRLALVGQLMFLLALGLGLQLGGLLGAAWCVSAAMVLYFGFYFWSLANWKETSDVATHAA
jgi:O-antigen/teichoic acid export membrane protein